MVFLWPEDWRFFFHCMFPVVPVVYKLFMISMRYYNKYFSVWFLYHGFQKKKRKPRELAVYHESASLCQLRLDNCEDKVQFLQFILSNTYIFLLLRECFHQNKFVLSIHLISIVKKTYVIGFSLLLQD